MNFKSKQQTVTYIDEKAKFGPTGLNTLSLKKSTTTNNNRIFWTTEIIYSWFVIVSLLLYSLYR